MSMACFFCALPMGKNSFCAMNMEFCSIQCRANHYKACMSRGTRAPTAPASSSPSDGIPHSPFFLADLIPSDSEGDMTMEDAPI